MQLLPEVDETQDAGADDRVQPDVDMLAMGLGGRDGGHTHAGEDEDGDDQGGHDGQALLCRPHRTAAGHVTGAAAGLVSTLTASVTKPASTTNAAMPSGSGHVASSSGRCGRPSLRLQTYATNAPPATSAPSNQPQRASRAMPSAAAAHHRYHVQYHRRAAHSLGGDSTGIHERLCIARTQL